MADRSMAAPDPGMPSLTVLSRFRGPRESANGGYVCGRVAAYLDGPVTVTLRRPPPLDTPMTVGYDGAALGVRHGDALVAQAASAPEPPALRVPDTVSMAEAQAARGRAGYFRDPVYPTCFVCGPDRRPGDGLRVFPGPVPGRAVWAAPWTPDASLASGGRHVPEEFVWAALDCPSGIAVAEAGVGPDLAILLGRMTASVAGLPAVGQQCRVVAWPTGRDGRKLMAGSALLGPGDQVLATAATVWLTVARPAPEPAAGGVR